MKITIPKFTLKEAGVFLLLLFLNFKFISITVIDNRSMVIDLIVYLLFVITFNYSNWTYKSLISTFLAVGIYTAINFSSYKLNVLIPLLVVQSVSGIRFTRYLWINLLITSGMLIYMYLTYGLGETWVNYSHFVDRRIRMTFGFLHPNVAAGYYFCFFINIMLLLGFSKWQKYIWVYLLLIIPLWQFVYGNTGSRSFLLALLVLYASYFYYFIAMKFSKKHFLAGTRYILISLAVTFTLITVYFALQSANFTKLNKILSGRLRLYHSFFNELTPIDFVFGSDAYKNLIIDSSYVHLLFEAGIVFFLLFCWFYILATYRMTLQKAWIPMCVIFSFMAYGLMESMLLYGMLIGTNIYWVTLYYYYRNGKMRL